MILSFPSFAGALLAIYDSPTFDRAAMSAARYTADKKTLDFLWHLKPSKYSVLCIRGVTQLPRAVFADRYGIPENTVGQWERGQRNPPEYVVMLLAYAVYCDFAAGALSAALTSGEW